MNPIKTLLLLLVGLTGSLNSCGQKYELKSWLATPPSERQPLQELDFAKRALSKSEAAEATALLLADQQKGMLSAYGSQWVFLVKSGMTP